jgi:uncharacterized protein involved in exopolysaccharide biosynthesis
MRVGLSLFDFILLMLRRWKLVATCMVVTSTIGITVALLMRPVYRSEVIVARSGEDLGLGSLSGVASSLGGLAALAGASLGAGGGASTESMGLLRSKALLVKLIEQKDLLPVLFPERVDSKTGTWMTGKKAPTMEDAVLLLDKNVREIREDAKTGLVAVRVEWIDRYAAAEWATALVDLANEESRRRAIVESDAALSLLREQWNKADSVGLRDALSKSIEGQLKSRTVATVREQFAFKVVDAARVSDPDKRVKPARTLMAIFSAAAGFVLAAVIVLLQRSLAAAASNEAAFRVGAHAKPD